MRQLALPNLALSAFRNYGRPSEGRGIEARKRTQGSVGHGGCCADRRVTSDGVLGEDKFSRFQDCKAIEQSS